MKKIIFILLTCFFSATMYAQVNTCCPEFSLKQMGDIQPCDGDSTCPKDTHGGGNQPVVQLMTACKNSAVTYYVFPNLPGFTFTWTVIGGTISSSTGNPKVITWGSGTQGLIQIIITDASGNCRDTINKKVCLLNSPVAAFTVAPSTTVCANSTPIVFTNTSTGAVSYSWNFGDGTGFNGANPPPHIYTTPGTYTVLLTVSNGSGGQAAPGGESRCGCTDTASIVINVISGSGPVITSSCKKMLCPGDTATYCVAPGCAPFNWTVNGGTIINNSGNCITVQWNALPPATLPASVSVTTGCGGVCGNAATLIVPVLWNNMPISGPNPVCIGSTTSYSLPTMPGTFYNWTVTGPGGGTIVGPNQNTATISVNWNGPPGTATITCNYNNPYSGCSGTSTRNIDVRPRFIATGPSPICTGVAGIYSITGGGLANWIITPSTGFTVAGATTNVSSINVTWTVAGTYTILATAANTALYCNPTSTINVVVNPTPVLSNITGPTSVCPGSYYTYSVSSNMNGPFVWTASAGGSVISEMGANKDSVIIQWTGGGPHSLTVSQTVMGCKATKVLSPITNVPPVTISGAANVCRDQSPHPLYTATGGLPPGSYTWSIVPAAAGTITGGQGTNQISVLWSGAATPGTSTANVQVVICNYTPVSFPVTITTPPNVTVTRSGSLCTLPGVTLSVSPSLPCYQWYLNGVAISGATSATYIATTHGYYEVKCPTQCSGYGDIFIPREYIPNVKISANNKLFYCPTEPINVTLFSAAGGACTFDWFKNGVSISGPSGTNSPLNVTTIGTYYQVVKCGNCKDTSNVIIIDTITCDPGPGCDFSSAPRLINDMDKAGPATTVGEDHVAGALTATLNIGPPTSLCNNTMFSAVYSFTAPHSLNSGIHWNFGDGGTFSTTTSGGFTPSHTYTAVGVYVVSAYVDVNCPPPPTPHVCRLTDTIHYVVPIAANFGATVHCDTVYLNSLSSVISGCTITSYAWSATGPGSVTFSNPAVASPIMTATASGTYNVTLTVTSSCNGCTATITLPVTINLPSATFTAPTPVCAGSPVSLGAPGGMSNYLWNFGDGYTSSTQNTTHTFGLVPANPTITLNVSNNLGCKASFAVPITVIPPPTLTVTPLQMICPGATATITATGSFTTFDFYHNNVLVQSGASNTYTTSAIGTYYVIANTASGGCAVKSALTYVFNHPKPVANILGSSTACMMGGTANIYLYNSINDPNTTYAWNLQGNATVLSNVFDLSVTVNAVGNYSYIITATDNITGCVARDTLCVVVGNTPVVTVTTTSTGTMCAGNLHTFQVTPYNPSFIYQWSNGATGQFMSTSLPGMYMVTVTDPVYGCFSTAFAGMIMPKPSTILFPIGCDTICDYDSIIPPLALGGPWVAGNYTVQWFLNGNYGSPIYTGPVLNLLGNIPPLVYGMNNISIVVTYNGCTDTSGTYNLFIKKCDSCDCEKSKWDKIILTKGNPDKPDDPKDAIVTDPKAVVIGPTGLNLNCDKTYKLECNKPYTINAGFICKDTLCPGKVTYILQPPSGSPITGSMPPAFTFTPSMSGIYTLTLYGWCGDTICDTCIIKFEVKCVECDCKGSKWMEKIVTIDGKTKSFNCKEQFDVPCKKPVTINAMYNCTGASCPGSVTYSLQPPSGAPITGTMPPAFTFTPNMTGTYTLTLYGWCGNTICDSCVIRFTTECKENCCPYEISTSTGTVTYDHTQIPNATLASETFTINGLATASITEVRANVVSYTIDDNYKKECMKCVNLPFTWASIASAGMISGVPGKITMYGGTGVPSFNGSGAGAYQNPREVIWNNGSPISIPNGTNINMNFILPPVPTIDCCELKGKICVKFIFRDKDCKECEVIACFDFVIKKK